MKKSPGNQRLQNIGSKPDPPSGSCNLSIAQLDEEDNECNRYQDVDACVHLHDSSAKITVTAEPTNGVDDLRCQSHIRCKEVSLGYGAYQLIASVPRAAIHAD